MTDSMWDTASGEIEAEATRRTAALAIAEAESGWGFLRAASSPDEYLSRKATLSATASWAPEVHAHFDERFASLQRARAAQRIAEVTKVADVYMPPLLKRTCKVCGDPVEADADEPFIWWHTTGEYDHKAVPNYDTVTALLAEASEEEWLAAEAFYRNDEGYSQAPDTDRVRNKPVEEPTMPGTKTFHLHPDRSAPGYGGGSYQHQQELSQAADAKMERERARMHGKPHQLTEAALFHHEAPASVPDMHPDRGETLKRRHMDENDEYRDTDRRHDEYWAAHPEEAERHRQQNMAALVRIAEWAGDGSDGMPFVCEKCGLWRNAQDCPHCKAQAVIEDLSRKRRGPTIVDWLAHGLFPSGASASKQAAEGLPSTFVPVRWHVYRQGHDGAGRPLTDEKDITSREQAQVAMMGFRELEKVTRGRQPAVHYLVAENAEGQRVPDFGPHWQPPTLSAKQATPAAIPGGAGSERYYEDLDGAEAPDIATWEDTAPGEDKAVQRMLDENLNKATPAYPGDFSTPKTAADNLFGGEQADEFAAVPHLPRTTRPRVTPQMKQPPAYVEPTAPEVAPAPFAQPTEQQMVAARVAKVAKRVLDDNPHLSIEAAREMAERALKTYPEMVRKQER